jgi:hypothetical protein
MAKNLNVGYPVLLIFTACTSQHTDIAMEKPEDFIPDETKELTIKVPLEFFNLCKDFDETPEGVLRGFIADVCGLQSLTSFPREDGYSSHGSDERRMAYDYLERAYGMCDDNED